MCREAHLCHRKLSRRWQPLTIFFFFFCRVCLQMRSMFLKWNVPPGLFNRQSDTSLKWHHSATGRGSWRLGINQNELNLCMHETTITSQACYMTACWLFSVCNVAVLQANGCMRIQTWGCTSCFLNFSNSQVMQWRQHIQQCLSVKKAGEFMWWCFFRPLLCECTFLKNALCLKPLSRTWRTLQWKSDFSVKVCNCCWNP